MTIASLLLALIVTTAADTNGGEPVLLDFHADWCSPCQTMRPEVEKLVRKGYPVKSIDIDKHPEISERYGIKAVPSFLIVDAQGRALTKKMSGVMPASQLATFYNETKAKLPPSVEPDPVDQDLPAPVQARESREAEPVSASKPLVNPLPWQTVVRIKIHTSNSEWAFGSGTIISSNADETIILTCAHIFRLKGRAQPKDPRDFPVPISVDLFDGQLTGRQPAMVRCSEKDVVGQAIDYDFTNDVGLIRIKPGRRLPASRVVPPDWQPKTGMTMFTVGCSHGNDATAWDTKILDPHVSMSNTGTKQSFATIKCANQPKEGRSGGGLYTTDGYVAGVCDFADPSEHVGLYAVPEAIHRILDRNQMMALYRRGGDRPDTMLASANRPRAGAATATRVRGQSPSEPELTAINREDVTIPPPSMFGIKADTTLANTKAGQWGGNPTRSQRTTRRPEVSNGDGVDPGARPNEALTTDLAIDPAGENKDIEAPFPPPARPAKPPAMPGPATATKWKSATQALPEIRPAGR